MHPARFVPWRSLLALACVLPCAVTAQEAELDEVVVTGDYRGRPLAEVPASISILDQQTIAETAVQHFEELIGGLANLNWSGDGHRARYIQIRGVGELAQYQGGAESVGRLHR